jgi:hypothetical protein
MSKKTSFQIMTSVLKTYNPTLEEKQSINSFFFCRFLSNHPLSIALANALNRFYKEIPVNIQYDITKDFFKNRKEKIKFIQFPKKESEDNKVIDNISRYYKISIETATGYFNLMADDEKLKFKDIYNEGVK